MSINRLRRAVATVLLMVFAAGAITSVAATADEIKAIKRDSRFIYGEATRLDEVEAQEEAAICLLQYVNDYLLNEGYSKGLTPKELKGVNYMSMEKKNGIRVLAYVEKSVLEGKGSTLTAAPQSRTLAQERAEQTAQNLSKELDFANTSASAEAEEPEVLETTLRSSTAKMPEPVEVAEPEPTREVAAAATAKVEVSQAAPQPTKTIEPAAPKLKPLTASARSTQKNAQAPADWRKATVYEIVGSGTIDEAWEQLDIFRGQGKVRRFGVPADVRHADSSHWVICDEEGNVLTVLGPIDETDKRHDYVSGEYKTLRDYPNALILWFELK